jgi:hypothetical protein
VASLRPTKVVPHGLIPLLHVGERAGGFGKAESHQKSKVLKRPVVILEEDF